jgi:hypothetical protein
MEVWFSNYLKLARFQSWHIKGEILANEWLYINRVKINGVL